MSSSDFDNANLMTLSGYIIIGHNDWKGSIIKIFAIYPEDFWEEKHDYLFELIKGGQLLISQNNIEFIAKKADVENRSVINEKSMDADLILLWFRGEMIKQLRIAIFEGYDNIGNTIFVNAADTIVIK